MTHRLLWRAVAVLACGVSLASCESPLRAGLPASLVVAPESVVVLELDSVRLSASVRDVADLELRGAPVAWVSADTAIIAVRPSGWSVGVTVGDATIFAASEGLFHPIHARVAVWLAELASGAGDCGVTTRGSVYCWGSRPQRVVSSQRLHGLTRSGHTCALDDDGRALCWGSYNYDGRLGTGDTYPYSTPTPVAGGLRFAQVSAGAMNTCGVTVSGQAYCWGAASAGALGTGDTLGVRLVPVRVSGGLLFQTLSVGKGHTCGLTLQGKAYCWGSAASGQLGNGSFEGRVAEPVAVMGEHVFTMLRVGDAHSCGVTANGFAYCWGRNWHGELGTTTAEECGTFDLRCSTTPTLVNANTWSIVAPGFSQGVRGFTCGLTVDGRAYCWGAAGLGNDNDPATVDPTEVPGGFRYASLSTGENHSCAMTPDGVAYCWGGAYSPTPQRLGFQP